MKAWITVLALAAGAMAQADDVAFVNEGIVDAPIDESLAMRRFFEMGNQQTIEAVQRHFARTGETK
jgi:hypothetical protein